MGKTTRGAEVPKEEYEFTSSSNKLNIAFKKETNKAYEIEYATKITDESVTSFKNKRKSIQQKSKRCICECNCNCFTRYTSSEKIVDTIQKHRRLNGRLLSTGTREILRKLMRF